MGDPRLRQPSDLGPLTYVKVESREFPGGPVVRTQRFPCWGPGSIPDPGTKIPQATWHSQKKTR